MKFSVVAHVAACVAVSVADIAAYVAVFVTVLLPFVAASHLLLLMPKR